MPEHEIPEGQRFSLVYAQEADLLPDSQRMRRRLSRVVFPICDNYGSCSQFSDYIVEKLGIDGVNYPVNSQSRWDQFYDQLAIGDVLDTITLFRQFLEEAQIPNSWPAHNENVRSIFRDTNVAYSVDDLGGVRHLVDQAFEVNRYSTIAGLEAACFAAARGHIAAIDQALMQVPSDGRQAIRSTFDAAENIFKQISGKDRMTAGFVTESLVPILEVLYTDDDIAKRSSLKIARSFREWVDGAHFYRHEAGQPDPHQPPVDLSILIVSQGISYVRWLANIMATTGNGE